MIPTDGRFSAHRILRAGVALMGLAAGGACASVSTDPSHRVRVDAVISPSSARNGEWVSITMTATNPSSEPVEWASGCGMNLGYEVRNAAGHVVWAPRMGVCTLEARTLTLGPGASLTETISWPVGFISGSARPALAPGTLYVRGQLGVGDQRGARGDSARLVVLP
ncbi:MAG TPA: hypothetical protein DGD08_10510 [Gemmatimonas aurantiaca]|uniref:Intracellular proteinase inhibitor BsuPI domain-containing protein n=2 Tax=Gemmatimonas aurantiaca TaxID=173480 RepID=C1ACZ4_GEMAT|nr:hypothetical protein [Gemmatimonas aurantiaca]BAH40371.1 hypothetical protein GAU_3329 [Gemmatimonas aurantiaca T-27]HCT57619.1 hypothetical protein [Gemmatimonas aurantiaca]